MIEQFPLTSPRRPFNQEEKIRQAAKTISTFNIDRMGARKQAHLRTQHTNDGTRLKLPWLTCYRSGSTQPLVGRTQTYTVVRMYFNRPALDALFPSDRTSKETRILYAAIDRAHKELVLLTRHNGGTGHPLAIHPMTGRYTTHSFIGQQLDRGRYLNEDESTYFPIRLTNYGIVIDLSIPFTKADAIAHEEDLRCRDPRSSSVISRRPGSSPTSTTPPTS